MAGHQESGRPGRLIPRVELRQLPGYVLYLITLFCQGLSAFARWQVVYLGLKLVGLFSPWSIPAVPIAWIVAGLPLVASALALICPPLICPITGRWWEMALGGRRPVQDELEAYERALDSIALEDEWFKAPRHWFVAEEDDYNASVFANSVCLTRGLLESREAAPAFLSHEYPHLRSGDGRLMCALQLLVVWPMEAPEILPLRSLPLRGLLWVASGSAVDWFFERAWDTYWRSREYVCDNYTIRVGQGPAFARSLRSHSLPYERPIRWMCFSTASHPYTKQRMARLEVNDFPPTPAGVAL
jgi:Zn-dependent protease with chaperone function